jgi:hypothetical protein
MRETIGRGIVGLLLGAALCGAARGVDEVSFRRDGATKHVAGRLVLTAADGGILLLARDGVLWNIEPKEQIEHTHDDRPFRPYTAAEMAASVRAELPKGFDVYSTPHYVIVFDTSRAYAQWCGGMFERLYGAFRNGWSRKGFDLAEPEFPLVAILFADKSSYAAYSRSVLGDAAESIIAYFNLATNRMVMYDLTGLASGRGGHATPHTQISQMLSSPEAMQTVATVVHEATHQIAFNCGLHTRYSDCPRWFSEGIAMYFETPDLRSSKGWAGIGAVNRTRLADFRQFLAERPTDSLQTLVASDRRFLELKQATETYAEAWALTYFLLRQHPKEYVEYLKMLSKKPPLVEDGSQRRMQQFEKNFGPWQKLDAEFLRFMARVR